MATTIQQLPHRPQTMRSFGTKVTNCCKVSIIYLSIFCVHFLDATKLKGYNLNKYTPYDSNFDCLHSTRKNISIPPEFSFCYRHKKNHDGIFWGSIFVGNVGGNWRSHEMGFEYLNWNYQPWLAITSPGIDVRSWLPMGETFYFNMLTWRHTCITLDIVSGASIVYENGKLL